jgi:nucleotide-binding universal stress UspA family protein
MFHRILVPVDGSTLSEQAIPHATRIAAAFDAQLELALVHVTISLVFADSAMRGEIGRVELEQRQREANYLNELIGRVSAEAGRAVEPVVLTGDVVPALEHEIEQRGVDLVIMTTHGRAGPERAWLGSVADALIRHVAPPVLLIRPDEHEAAPARAATHVLIALDGSERAERALAPATALARADAARVTLLRVVAPPRALSSPFLPHAIQFSHDELQQREHVAHGYIEGKVKELKLRELGCTGEVVVGYHPAHTLLQYAETHGVDLIALGTHGHGPMTRLVLGSVSDKVVRAADVPVLIC